MYVPEHFKEDDRDRMLAFAKANAFAVLVSMQGTRPFATHLPVAIETSGDTIRLHGHLARANPHCELLDLGPSLVVFHGPHTYISPTWYANAGVPTWNYVAVHMSGQATTYTDPDALAALVGKLSDTYEAGNAEPWDQRYSPAMLRAITGFTLAVDTLEGKRKLSQNREPVDQARVVTALAAPFGGQASGDDTAIAQLMRDNLESR